MAGTQTGKAPAAYTAGEESFRTASSAGHGTRDRQGKLMTADSGTEWPGARGVAQGWQHHLPFLKPWI